METGHDGSRPGPSLRVYRLEIFRYLRLRVKMIDMCMTRLYSAS